LFFFFQFRMKVLAVLLMSLALTLGLPIHKYEQPPHDGYRLLKTGELTPGFWVPQEVVEILSQNHYNFIDITDHQVVDPSLSPIPSAIPSQPLYQSIVNPLINQIDMGFYEDKLNELSSFRNRYYTGYGDESAEWVFNLAKELSNNRSDITVTKFTHQWAQPSVIAKIQGSKTEELVIVGAHQDSTSPGMPSGVAPGVDDDGSGSTALFEILRLLVSSNFKPEYTIELQWYAAEEVGLLGSQAIANSYQQQGKAVRGMMQLDMIGYNGKESTVGIITDNTSSQVNAFNRLLVDEYLEIGWTNSLCGYGCSDHASWNRYGYPSSFPFEAQMRNSNPSIHTTSDTLDKIDLNHAKEFVKLGVAFVIELSHE